MTPSGRPAVVDGQLVWLPTLAGLLAGQPGLQPAPQADLGIALAAAIVADEAFEDLERELASGRTLAQVIDIDGAGS